MPMKIIQFSGENFRRLKAVRIRPDGPMVQITGANEQGKSSVLDGLWVLLKGRAVAGPEPIRRGTEKAVLAGHLGEDRVQWEVVRTFQRTADGDLTMSLQVTEVEADGTRRRITKSPQAVLDGFLGALSFDPLAFARAKPAEQFDVLKRFVPGFDFERNAAQRKARFDERTDINRERDRARAAATTLSAKLPLGPKPARVDVTAALSRLAQANAQIARNKLDLMLRQKRSDDIRAAFDEAEMLRARATTLEREANATLCEMAELPPIPKDPDINAMSAAIADANQTNAVAADHEQHDKLAAEAMLHEQHSQDRTKAIEALDRERNAAIAAAQMPVEELTLGDGVVLYQGIPFEQASSSAKLKVSTLVAMAANPELRIIRSYDGGLLDSKSLGAIAAIAGSKGWQFWVESVDESGKVGFVIEDGEVANG